MVEQMIENACSPESGLSFSGMRRLSAALVTVFLFAVLAGCGIKQSLTEAQATAQSLLDASIASEEHIPSAAFAPAFWRATSTDNWETSKSVIDKAHGPLRSYTPNGWHSFSGSQHGLSGSFITLNYKVMHEKAEGTLKLIMYRKEKTDPYLILNYNLSSAAIQQLQQEALKKVAEGEKQG